ncbi:MAG: sigma-70 family RNA polymerase sigma factor [Lewinellaceae bacterium]|nr:sigma-70 family RNA polymerase sigma factor [Lewinellaceae bacterium]
MKTKSIIENSLSMLAAFLMSVAPQQSFEYTPGAPIVLSPKAKQCLHISIQESEADLIRQTIAGDHLAYTTLVRRYERMVFGLAFQMLGNREDALEVTQDAFLKAFRFLSGYRGESRFSTWLYRIARTSAINYLRRARRDTIALDSPESPVRRMSADAPNGFETMANSERSALLLRAFNMLLPDDGAVLRLFYLQEQSLEEICEIMDWSMSNAKSRLCRARQRLRTVLVGRFANEFADWI